MSTSRINATSLSHPTTIKAINKARIEASTQGYPSYALNRKGEPFLKVYYLGKVEARKNGQSFAFLDKKAADVTKTVYNALAKSILSNG